MNLLNLVIKMATLAAVAEQMAYSKFSDSLALALALKVVLE